MNNILIIEDESSVSEILKAYLEKEGYKVFCSQNGLDGIELFRKNNIKLVILDLMLPGMNGYEICQNIRIKSTIPILILSAKIDEFDKVNSALYNAFYQMFDEGELEDINYLVDVSNCIFILTTNFSNDQEIAENLGLPIFSRIDLKIEFQNLTETELLRVVDNIFNDVTAQLSEEDKEFIENYGLKETYRKHVGSFENIRLLKSFIEKDVFQIIFEKLLKRDNLE